MQILLALLLAVAACGRGPRAPAAISHHEAPPVAIADTDGDGIPDGRDGCPTVPEDFDLYQDEDGCPDLDDDHDGVPDDKDACFDTPGVGGEGCPEGCSYTTTSTDCWSRPLFTDASPTAAAASVKKLFDEYPEILMVTLSTDRNVGEPTTVARARLERAERALVAAGTPAAKLTLELRPERTSGPPTSDVFGIVTKQRFEDGKFRTAHCAGDMGSVYRVSRERNYHCKPRICGDGECWPPTEDHASCPQDCTR